MNPHDDERGARIVAGGNRFAFIGQVRRRADEIARGAPPRIVTTSTKPVTIAIEEAARGRALAAHVPIVAHVPHSANWIIDCRDCGKSVTVRRKTGMPLQGRPPTRCAACGISPNWEQIFTDV